MINFHFKRKGDILALIRKGRTMAQKIVLLIIYITAGQHLKIFDFPRKDN